jgi:hypothetical protein
MSGTWSPAKSLTITVCAYFITLTYPKLLCSLNTCEVFKIIVPDLPLNKFEGYHYGEYYGFIQFSYIRKVSVRALTCNRNYHQATCTYVTSFFIFNLHSTTSVGTLCFCTISYKVSL